MALSSIGSNSSAPALSGLNAAQKKQNDAVKQLISGLRVSSAADDASGFSISTQLDSQIRGLNAASYNGQSAVSLLQTANGGLDQTTAQLQRVRDLAVQAAGTSDTGALSAITNEIDQSLQEVDRIAQSTSFGSTPLLNGNLAAGTKFQIGASGGAADQFNVAIPKSDTQSLGLSGLAASVSGGGAVGALASIDEALKTVSSTRTTIGSAQNSLTSAVSAISNEIVNASSSKSLITDADMAEAIMNKTLGSIQNQASTTMLVHSNQQARSTLQLIR